MFEPLSHYRVVELQRPVADREDGASGEGREVAWVVVAADGNPVGLPFQLRDEAQTFAEHLQAAFTAGVDMVARVMDGCVEALKRHDDDPVDWDAVSTALRVLTRVTAEQLGAVLPPGTRVQ